MSCGMCGKPEKKKGGKEKYECESCGSKSDKSDECCGKPMKKK